MIFVDTGAWIALTDRSDQYHQEAIMIYTALKQRRELFLTTDMVVAETVTRLRYDVGHRHAVTFLELIEQSKSSSKLQVVMHDHNIYRNAVTLFCQYKEVVLSFADCVSFIVCQQYQIVEAFAFDQHFAMMGINLSTP